MDILFTSKGVWQSKECLTNNVCKLKILFLLFTQNISSRMTYRIFLFQVEIIFGSKLSLVVFSEITKNGRDLKTY